MAAPNVVPADHRKHIRWVPDDICESLSPAELRLRCAEMYRLHETANGTKNAEHARYLVARAQQIGRAMPVCCAIEHRRKLNQRMHGASSRVERLSDGSYASEFGTVHAMLREHREDHIHPSGLESDVDNAFLSRMSSPDAQAIVAHHERNHGR
jgi:hypothetical protein